MTVTKEQALAQLLGDVSASPEVRAAMERLVAAAAFFDADDGAGFAEEGVRAVTVFAQEWDCTPAEAFLTIERAWRSLS